MFKLLCGLWALVALSVVTGCNLCHMSSLVPTEVPSVSQLDALKVRSQLNDSVIKILKRPQVITCVLGTANPVDTARIDTARVMPRNLYPVLDFLFWDPSNFVSNDIVFGNFVPSASYIIKGQKSGIVTLEFDFGLKKWRIQDEHSNIILTADMKEEALPLLRLTRIIFPKDITLQLLYENLTSISK